MTVSIAASLLLSFSMASRLLPFLWFLGVDSSNSSVVLDSADVPPTPIYEITLYISFISISQMLEMKDIILYNFIYLSACKIVHLVFVI